MQNSNKLTIIDKLSDRVIFFSVMLLFITITLISALTTIPAPNDALFANASYNLYKHGFMGTTVVETAGFGFYQGIDRHTYWIMPLYLLLQSLWFKIFGFSLLSTRSLGIVLGIFMLCGWFIIVSKLTGNRRIALLAIALLSCDFWFLTESAIGRGVDIMSAALGTAGLALYLLFRERNFNMAILLSNTLIAMCGLTHWLGLAWFCGLIFMILYFDRSKIRFTHIAIAAVPYLIGAGLWATYILQSPSDFYAQFTRNAADSGRLQGLTNPLSGLVREVMVRYRMAFGLGAHTAGHGFLPALKGFVLIAYLAGIFGAIFNKEMRQHKGSRVLLSITIIFFLFLSYLEGQKLTCYLLPIIPFYCAMLAILIFSLRPSNARYKYTIWVGVGFVVLLQVGGLLKLASDLSYQKSYLPAINYLKSNISSNTSVMGSPQFGFALGFDGKLTDDTTLGYYSGKKPDLIVVGEDYRLAFNNFRLNRYEVYQYITNRLNTEYKPVYDKGNFTIYARNQIIGKLR
jgi:4-amino-4-deoxy-L-arabinose transferase-like glycosyltransferase